MDRVCQAEPTNTENGSGAVYMPLLVQPPLFLPKRSGDKALYSPEVPRAVIQWEVDFQGTCLENSSQSRENQLEPKPANVKSRGLTEKKHKAASKRCHVGPSIWGAYLGRHHQCSGI